MSYIVCVVNTEDMRMNPNRLHYFRVLAKTGHYTQTANQLGITQPSLSRTIAALEKDLGYYLFEKQGRDIKLTRYGRIFYKYIDKGLQEVDLGERRLRKPTFQENEWIDLAFIYTLDSHYVPHLLQSFLAQPRNRKIKFSLRQGNTTETLQGLKEEKYDVTFHFYVDGQPDINSLPIAQEEAVAIVSRSHPLAVHDSVNLAQLEGKAFVCYDRQSGIRPLLGSLFEQVGIEPNIICEVEEDSAATGLVAINYGIALVPNIAILEQFPVKKLTITNPPHERYTYLAAVKNRYLPPAVHAFRNFIVHHTSIKNPHING